MAENQGFAKTNAYSMIVYIHISYTMAWYPARVPTFSGISRNYFTLHLSASSIDIPPSSTMKFLLVCTSCLLSLTGLTYAKTQWTNTSATRARAAPGLTTWNKRTLLVTKAHPQRCNIGLGNQGTPWCYGLPEGFLIF